MEDLARALSMTKKSRAQAGNIEGGRVIAGA
jgi:hypothetical protein